MERNVKDANKVKLLRYECPITGPRKTPSLDKMDDGKIKIGSGIEEQIVFKIDLDANIVRLHNIKTSQTIDIGDTIIYRV